MLLSIDWSYCAFSFLSPVFLNGNTIDGYRLLDHLTSQIPDTINAVPRILEKLNPS